MAKEQFTKSVKVLMPASPLPIHRHKRARTVRTMDVLKEYKFNPALCVIDHNNEETIRDVLDRGYWCAFSIYPQTKMGSEHGVLVECFGPERLIVDFRV